MPGKYDRTDAFYRKAKAEGYKSRASFKLMELDKLFKLFRKGSRVLDLGAWPGGWVQVAAERIGPEGCVVGLDLVQLEGNFGENAIILVGNAQDANKIDEAVRLAKGKFDVVMSDMSPKLTGIREADWAASVACAEMALEASKLALTPGGSLVIKVFKSNETEVFVKSMRPLFNRVSRNELDSSRKTSTEFYLVGTGFKVGSLK